MPVSHVNGERNKTEEADLAKWKSLSVSSISVHKEEPGVSKIDAGTKNKEAVLEDGGDVFARPTLRPSELAARLMPPPSMPGKRKKGNF